MPRAFLKAHWAYLVMLNYEMPPEILQARIPVGTELDDYRGRNLVSMVGFWFTKTRLKGIPIPFHRHFEEVNLRFYVRRYVGDEVRRGVVFVKEIVPRRALAVVARLFYNENYVAMPMSHVLDLDGDLPVGPTLYRWHTHEGWNELGATARGRPSLPERNSQEAFITEHYWGYAAQRDGGTIEYRVAHPPWEVWPVASPVCKCNAGELYGQEFAAPLSRPPTSAFMARGSVVQVFAGKRIA